MNKKKKMLRRRVILICFFVLAAIITFTLIFVFKTKFIVKGFKDKIDVQYNEDFKEQPFTVCFGNLASCVDLKPTITGKVDTKKMGDYELTYKYKYNNKTYTLKQKVSVVDKIGPEIEFESGTVCPNGKINEVKFKVIDNIDGDITDKAKIEYKDKKLYIEAEDSSKNKTIKEFDVKVSDDVVPVITLNGNDVVSLRVGEQYNEDGATADDACDGSLDVEISNDVNTSIAGSYTVTYKAKDSSGNVAESYRTVNVYDVNSGERVVYLTFDDGPSDYTSTLLDVLAKYDVKATFFVTKNGSDDIIRREYNEGHTVALHTYTHDYSYLYSSVDSYFEDLNAVSNRVKSITGKDPNMIRFPGGSSNMISSNYDGGSHIMTTLVNEINKRGYYYYDWNVDSDDAGSATTSDEVYSNVVNTLKEGSSIVLQHDIKGFSVDAVERIIQYGLNNGYTFRRLEPGSPEAHHGVNN